MELPGLPNVAVQKGSFLPEVFAYGLYELRKTDLSPIEPEWAAGIGARFEGNAEELLLTLMQATIDAPL